MTKGEDYYWAESNTQGCTNTSLILAEDPKGNINSLKGGDQGEKSYLHQFLKLDNWTYLEQTVVAVESYNITVLNWFSTLRQVYCCLNYLLELTVKKGLVSSKSGCIIDKRPEM